MINRFFIKTLLIINVLSIVFLFLAYLAAYISPSKIPILAFFSLVYAYIIFINIAFFIFWAFLRKWYFVLSFLALLLGAKSLNTYFRFIPIKKEQVVSSENNFTVLSYNVQVFSLYKKNDNLETKKHIFQFIREQNPNIACLQEYYDEKKGVYPVKDSLMKHQKFNYSHIYYTRSSTSQLFGIATYSSYPIVNKQIIKFPDSPNASIFSDIKIGKDTLRFFNCHLQSIGFSQEDYSFIDSIAKPNSDLKIKKAQGVYTRLKRAYKKRTEQINLIVEQIKISPYPVFICGDFNDPPSSYVYHFLRRYLNDSFVEKGKGKGATFSRNIFSYRIDYILHSNLVNCHEFKVEKVDYSDHYPIIGTYSLR